jgi:subtilase family serine protease
MNHKVQALLGLAALAALAACSENPTQPKAITGSNPSAARSATGFAMRAEHARVCPGPAAAGHALCHSIVQVDKGGKPKPNPTPSGYAPADLLAAYNLGAASASGGSGQVVAIVDAYDDPNAESDLAVYRSQFGLPACTTSNGCFRKVDQNGGTNYPRANSGWAEEISLDLDMVSAICPNCKILLVEAASSSFSDLSASVDRAAAMGATEISNSYGGSEYSSETSDQSHYDHPGIAITVSTGDNGYGVEFPAASRYVTAVGGTSLYKSGNAYSETAWSGAGSGCSAYIAKPSWQTDGGCANRTVGDVSAVADPNTGVAVYDTYRLHPGGWLVFGGTSVSAPIVAGVYALAGNAASLNYASLAYSNTSSLNDVTSGSNGSCGGSYLCTAVAGYDGPTGNGTPSGTGAF